MGFSVIHLLVPPQAPYFSLMLKAMSQCEVSKQTKTIFALNEGSFFWHVWLPQAASIGDRMKVFQENTYCTQSI